jgi:N-acyl homoserine lactone hydrolase
MVATIPIRDRLAAPGDGIRTAYREGALMTTRVPIAITPLHVGDLLGVEMPIYVHLIDHPGGRVLVDTGLTRLHPAVADLDPRIFPLNEQNVDIGSIDLVVNTHLHFDHCGGNHLFAGTPIYVQTQELEDARNKPDYTISDWVDPPEVALQYEPVDGPLEVLPGVRLLPAPGHTRGSQIVVIDTGGRPIVIAGDTAVWFGELDQPETEGQRLVRALDPQLVWMSHADEPWRPDTSPTPTTDRA